MRLKKNIELIFIIYPQQRVECVRQRRTVVQLSRYFPQKRGDYKTPGLPELFTGVELPMGD